MGLKFCSFSSGSSGNCYMVKTETTTLLVDVGISAKRIMDALKNTETENLKGILLTHEHIDHVRGLRVLLKRIKNLPVFANNRTWDAIGNVEHLNEKRIFETGENFLIGDIEIKAFHTYHDAAEPVGYSFLFEGRKLSIVTDTGKIGENILEEIKDADTIVIEANHEEELLLIGRYPYYLKRRILSDHGHLSNKAAIEVLKGLIKKDKKKQILFAHLSKENNFPEMVIENVKEAFPEEEGFTIDILRRDTVSCIYLV